MISRRGSRRVIGSRGRVSVIRVAVVVLATNHLGNVHTTRDIVSGTEVRVVGIATDKRERQSDNNNGKDGAEHEREDRTLTAVGGDKRCGLLSDGVILVLLAKHCADDSRSVLARNFRRPSERRLLGDGLVG